MEAPHMLGLQPVVPISVFSPCYLIKKPWTRHQDGSWQKRKGGREKKRGRETALCVPQRSINTLKALNPKSITITPSPGQRICLLLFHKTTNHWKQQMSEVRRPQTQACLECRHLWKRPKQWYIVSYWLVACCGYRAVTADRVTRRADGIIKWKSQGCDLYSNLKKTKNVLISQCSIHKYVWNDILKLRRWTLSFPTQISWWVVPSSLHGLDWEALLN